MGQDYKKWLRSTIIGILGIMMFVVLLQIIVDPYFHYHKPITKYRLNDERYINDGIARHFDYDAIITGNSLCQNFSTSQYDELFGTKSVKLPFSGAGYKEIWESLGRALEYNDGVKEVLVCMDLQDLDREAEWERYEGNPTYLYDDNILNDVKYVFNKDAIYRGTLYNLLWTATGHESTSMDEYSSWERISGPYEACSSLVPITNEMSGNTRMYDNLDEERISYNLVMNVLTVVENNPDVEFKLLIPPSSIARWAQYYEEGDIEYRINGLKYALNELIKHENVQLWAFDDAFEVTTNLMIYSDAIHYDSSINQWMLEEISMNHHIIKHNFVDEYCDRIKEYYLNYPYIVLNRYISEEYS